MIELPRAADGRIRLILRTDGTMEVIEKPLNITQTREAIGAEALDSVSLHHLGEPLYVMLVDDNAYETVFLDHGGGHMELKPVKALRPDNPAATELYHVNCKPGITHRIIGDVFICPDDDYA